MKIKIAFAGTGYINQIHAESAARAGAELAAVVNHRPESMAAFAERFNIRRQYASVEAMLADGGVDALVVSTPNYLHAPQTIQALEGGVHVLVEKPMAMNASEAQRMNQAARASGATLMVAHCWRFDEDVLWLKQHANRIGKIIRTKSYSVHVRWGPSGWFTRKEWAGGGAMADMGIHAIDTTRFLLGDPAPLSVYARIGAYYHESEVDDTALAIIQWDNGVVSYLEAGWWQPHADGPEAATQLYGLEGFAGLFPTRLELARPNPPGSEVVESGLPFPRGEGGLQPMYDAQMAYFLNCVRGRTIPVPGGREGLVNMKILDAAYESARSGNVAAIQPE